MEDVERMFVFGEGRAIHQAECARTGKLWAPLRCSVTDRVNDQCLAESGRQLFSGG